MAHAKILALTDSEIVELETIIRQRTNQAQIVDRSKMLLYKSQGMTNGEIADRLDVNINTVKLCLNKYKAGGIQRALYDDQRAGRPVEITAPGRFGIFAGTMDAEESPSAHSKERRSGRISKIKDHYKTNGSKNIAKIRYQTIQNQVLLRKAGSGF